ncbi:hypothetical protein QYE76_050196 [Lolium multiflorum]|uniref:Reverse transcriptase Ty1/copia-type domain-containing protein n=1 Tax=Lolium multiflorum TaxID=4521 RepID=A0AAD8SPH3_LOLMU|nr:hypothetical protein QYE76_050196 [Lolium multiflorum]
MLLLLLLCGVTSRVWRCSPLAPAPWRDVEVAACCSCSGRSEYCEEGQLWREAPTERRFLVVKSGVDDMNVGTIFESRDATFFEDIFPMRDMHGMSSWESDSLHENPMEFSESDDESSDSDEDDNEAPRRNYWKEAVQNEMDSILANGTWELTEHPYVCKPVECKWVFKKKLRADGTIEKYKARLVAKGYTERKAMISLIPNHLWRD